MPSKLPLSLVSALGPLLEEVAGLGATPTQFEESPDFGNFVVSFTTTTKQFSIVHDRGQFLVDGVPREELEPAGLWRAFAGPTSLRAPLLAWLRSANSA